MTSVSELLDPRLVSWARQNGWRRFTAVQERSFRTILTGTQDLIIGGATSSGKTEAAFLPLMTLAARRRGSISVLCISPTRSLINDQYRRLVGIGQAVGVPVHKWHGEAPKSGKDQVIALAARGMVLITPESLEGWLIRLPILVQRLTRGLDAVVIDELHDCLEGARGNHVSSLLARLDLVAPEPLRKIGLSATLGDVGYAKKWLSPTAHGKVQLIDERATESKLLACVRGYEAPLPDNMPARGRQLQARQRASLEMIAAVLFERHRTGTHLVFAGSKTNTEILAAQLKARAASSGMVDRFYTHHGNMGGKERERIEHQLRLGTPMSVITTTTLELGIDIGSVDAIDHIGAPHSLTALRQRVGRSGRRGDPSIVTIHVTEEPLAGAFSFLDKLRLNTVRAIASLNLLRARFVEPPEADGSMLTVVLHQSLSHVYANPGVMFADLARLMTSVAAFERLSSKSYEQLLRELCGSDLALLRQSDDGRFFLSERGEKLFESNEIYASFQSSYEWDVWSRTQREGSLPRSWPIEVGDQFRLGGKAWKVTSVRKAANRLIVEPSSSGAAPHFNVAGHENVHPILAAQMRRVLADQAGVPPGCDQISAEFLCQGRTAFRDAELNDRVMFHDPDADVCHLFTWAGSRFNLVLAVLLRLKRFACDFNEVAVSASCVNPEHIVEALSGVLPSIKELSAFVESLNVGKFDKWVPEPLLREDWAKRHVGLEEELRLFCNVVAREAVSRGS